MILERWISIIGIVIGSAAGLFYGWRIYIKVYELMHSWDRWFPVDESYSETVIVLSAIAMAIIIFVSILLAAKRSSKIINRIIKQ